MSIYLWGEYFPFFIIYDILLFLGVKSYLFYFGIILILALKNYKLFHLIALNKKKKINKQTNRKKKKKKN